MFSVEVTRHDASTVIEVIGDADYGTRDAINAAVTDALAAPGAELVIDLQAVSFIDSIGVEAAIATPARAASTLGLAFRVEPSANVRRILSQMGLEDLLQWAGRTETRTEIS